ncbi:MAG: DEAD/DEAH box helicase [Methanobacteriota archaeon]
MALGEDTHATHTSGRLQANRSLKKSRKNLPILHGLTDPASDAIALYAEIHLPGDAHKTPGRKPGDKTLPQYPHASTTDLGALITRITGHSIDQFKTTRWIVHLPVSAGIPLTSLPTNERYPDAFEDMIPLLPFYVPVILCPYDIFLDLWRGGEVLQQEYILGDSLIVLFNLVQFSLNLIEKGRFKPGIRRDGMRYTATWEPSLTTDEITTIKRYAAILPPVSQYILHRRLKRDTVNDPYSRVYTALTMMMQVIIKKSLTQHPLDIRPGRRMREDQKNELALIAALTGKDLHVSDHQMEKAFAEEMHAWLTYGGKEQTFGKFNPCILMQEPPEGEDSPWKISLHLRSEADPSLIIPAETIWNLTSEPGGVLPPASYLQQELLSGLGKAVSASPVIKKYLTGTHPNAGECSINEAGVFLTTDAPAIREKGVDLLLPAWWTEQRAKPRLELQASRKSGIASSGMLGISELISFDYRISIGDDSISPEEFKQASALKAPFVRVGGRWVSCDSVKLSQALKNFEKRYIRGKPTAGDLFRLSMSEAADEDITISVQPKDEWAADLLSLMKNNQDQKKPQIPTSFKGVLRKYQEDGHAFLLRCTEQGFGVCLADDMGLGKTPQTIAWLLSIKKTDPKLGPALLVCPMSVVGNWEREFDRFSPSLKIWTHHGSSRTKGVEFAGMIKGYDVVITTYHLAARDKDELTLLSWSVVILDEAQNIKNPHTNQTKAIKKLIAQRRVALTGTPVENRLLELWSIMDFLNPGYLGTQHAFQERYSVQIEQEKDQQATAELRRLIRPFILRRMKTDQSIITDLPEKMESKVYCSLTREQATLYQAVVNDMAETLDTIAGIARKGSILAGITRLKQICNHPGLIAKDTGMKPQRSGKVRRVIEMLEEVCDEGDSSLIFSQYATFAKEMAEICRNQFSCPVLLLTGSTPRKERERLISIFQSCVKPAIFVISLKAGGTGLNLTAATHVFHIDRWWNPAVEDQATDRTFRIGQKRNVQVHLMIAAGTLEERIDEMNTKKRAMAEGVLAQGEDFLTSLSTQELLQIVTLRDSVFSGEED